MAGIFEMSDRPYTDILRGITAEELNNMSMAEYMALRQRSRVRTPLAPIATPRDEYAAARQKYVETGDELALAAMLVNVQPEVDYDHSEEWEPTTDPVVPEGRGAGPGWIGSDVHPVQWLSESLLRIHPLVWLALIAVVCPVSILFVSHMVALMLIGVQALSLVMGVCATKHNNDRFEE